MDAPEQTKTCTKCQRNLPLTSFYTHKGVPHAYPSCGECQRKQVKVLSLANYHRWRRAALDSLGGACVRCGIDDYRVLQIDHVNDDGYLHRKGRTYSNSRAFYRAVTEKTCPFEVQLLCANCHAIKSFHDAA